MTLRGELIKALAISLQPLMIGFTITAVLGILIGLLIGRYRLFDEATDWLINALYATPLVGVIPVVILWFGLDETA